MKKIFVPITIILLCISMFMTVPCKASTVWSDNFDDGNYYGWTVMNGTFISQASWAGLNFRRETKLEDDYVKREIDEAVEKVVELG